MNKTINIHLAKIPFSLDENAYEVLKKYLDDLRLLFEKTKGKEEILEDIEARIAELFVSKQQHPNEVITQKEVEEVIETLGAPEDYMEDSQETETPKQARKLYRDTDDRFVGGVCGGLSHYLGIESVWIRVILLLLVFSSIGGVIMVYILLWILVPEASTTAEKLKMRGEPVNVKNIKKKIKEELDQVSDTVKDMDYQSMSNNLKESSKLAFSWIARALQVLLRLLRVVVGVLLLFWSTLSLFALFISAFIGTLFTTLIPNEIISTTMLYDIPLTSIVIIGVLLVGIPFVFLFTLSVRLLSQSKQIMGRSTQLVLGGLWFLSLLSIITLGVIESNSMALTAKNRSVQSWPIQVNDTLRLKLNDAPEFYESITLFNNDRLIVNANGEQMRLGNILKLNIVKSEEKDLRLVTEKLAKGWTQEQAQKRAEEIQHEIDYYDQVLLIDKYWQTKIGNKQAEQKVKLTLNLPEGQLIFIDNDWASRLEKNIANDQNYGRYELVGHLWKMKKGELVCQDCHGLNGEAKLDEEGFEMKMKQGSTQKTLQINIDEKGLKITTEENDSRAEN